MKATAIFIFLAIFINNIAFAEKGEKREKPDIDALIVQLKLDKSKGDQLKKILEEQREVMKAKREHNREKKQKMTREQRQEKRQQHEAQREAMDEKLLTVLSYEQLYKFKKYMRKFRQQQGKNKNRQRHNQ